MNPFTIKDVRAHVLDAKDSGGDYHRRSQGHWLVDTLIANPMSKYADYQASRTSWGIGVLGSVVVEIESEEGTVGVSTALGGPPAAFMIEEHFKRFLVKADARDLNRIWDQMFRASMYYGRKGVTLAAISAVDLALWDLLGRLRGEPVYQLIGGATKPDVPLYCTGVKPGVYKKAGFLGCKLPLPYGPADGPMGLRKNIDFFRVARREVGEDYQLMVDCYMSLDVPYAIDLARGLADLGIYWIEEALHPDDFDGHRLLKKAVPEMRWTTGEHEYTRYGFRKLIEGRSIDVLQPDIMWVGGLTELLRISAMAAAYDIPVIPHGSGPYSYHFVLSQPHSPYCEYLNTSPAGDEVLPVFGDLFEGERLPIEGRVALGTEPGWGLRLNARNHTLTRPYEGGKA